MHTKGLGALHPPGFEWQTGKTAGSIRFVQVAQNYIDTCQDNDKIERLKKAIEEIKTGKLVITEWLTAEEFLKR